MSAIDYFTVVGFLSKPLYKYEGEVGLVLKQTSFFS